MYSKPKVENLLKTAVGSAGLRGSLPHCLCHFERSRLSFRAESRNVDALNTSFMPANNLVSLRP